METKRSWFLFYFIFSLHGNRQETSSNCRWLAKKSKKKNKDLIAFAPPQPGALIATLGAASVAKVIYDLVANKDSNISSIFSMDKKGDLSLIGRLDWETRKSYTMYVRAESRTSPALVDTMQVDIEVSCCSSFAQQRGPWLNLTKKINK